MIKLMKANLSLSTVVGTSYSPERFGIHIEDAQPDTVG